MKSTAMTIAMCLSLAFAGSAAAQVAEGIHQPPEQVGARVHVMRQPDRIWSAVIGNVTIIEQRDGVVLIDSGGTLADGSRVVEAVRKLTTKPVKAVVITHWHNDHSLGLGSIVRAWPRARIIATRATRDLMTSVMGKNVGLGKNDPKLDRARLNRNTDAARDYDDKSRDPALSEEERREYAIEARFVRVRVAEQMGAYIVLPTVVFTDSFLLPDPDAPIELHFLGHANTAGDAVAWLPRQRILVTGDVVVAPVPYGFNAPPASWIKVLERVRSFDFATLIPGHGAPEHDKTYVDRMIASLTDVRRQVGELAAQGLSAEEVQKRVRMEDDARGFVGDSAWGLRIFHDYWQEPIVDSAWREAKGTLLAEGS